jgi:hypothetical protein
MYYYYRSGTPEVSHLEDTAIVSPSGEPPVPSRSSRAISKLSGAIADSKVESSKNGTSKAGRIAVLAIGGLICVGFALFLIVCVIGRPLPQHHEEDETSKRPLPGTLLDEMEFESPITLVNTAVNADFEPDAHDFCA